MSQGQQWPVPVDTTKPHPARLYDFYLGGKDNYLVDREAAREVLARAPETRLVARANRMFLGRVVRYLTAEAGVRRFLDVGTGIPTAGNVHEVANAVDPQARIVYVDNDPIVHVHANALLTGSGTTSIVLADLRQPQDILAAPAVQELLAPGEPVGLLLIAILHFLTDDDDLAGIVAAFREALPPGSFLAISHVTHDFRPEAAEALSEVYSRATAPAVFRSHDEIATFFTGAALVEPGLVQVPLWRPEPDAGPVDLSKIWIYGGVGRWEVPGA